MSSSLNILDEDGDKENDEVLDLPIILLGEVAPSQVRDGGIA